MINREKVAKGLKQHRDGWLHSCDNCPYVTNADCQFQLYSDALVLLKEWEAIKPTKFQRENDFRSELVNAYRCGNCQHELDECERWNYCPKCGRKVKWE